MIGGGRWVYVAYQIGLFKNDLVFKFEVMPAYRVLERANSLAEKYS